MNIKTLAPLIVAVILGGIAAILARRSLSARHAGPPVPRTVNVVVAKTPVAPGQELSAEQLQLGQIAAVVAPPESFTNIADVVGRVTTVPLAANQPLMSGFLAPRGSAARAQALVPSGMRAVTVDVSESGGVAGLLTPGCHVDVVSTFVDPDTDHTTARTIVQNAPVIAVGTRLAVRTEPDKDPQPFRNVTLLATPREAEAIELASSVSRTRLVLRGGTDQVTGSIEGVTFFDLKGKARRITAATGSGTQQGGTQPGDPATRPIETARAPLNPGNPTTKPADPFAVVTPVRKHEAPPRPHITIIEGGAEREVVFDVETGPKLDARPEEAVTGTAEPRDPVGSPK